MPQEEGFDRPAVLRVDIDGGWTLSEVAQLLETIDSAYSALGAASFVADEWPRPYWRGGPRGSLYGNWADRYVAFLQFRVSAELGALRLHRMSYASPGFIEALGALGPFKSIVDLVNGWRRENTDRARLDEETRQFDENSDRQRIQNDRAYLLDLLDRMREAPPEVREVLLPGILGELPRLTSAIAADIRVRAIEVRELD